MYKQIKRQLCFIYRKCNNNKTCFKIKHFRRKLESFKCLFKVDNNLICVVLYIYIYIYIWLNHPILVLISLLMRNKFPRNSRLQLSTQKLLPLSKEPPEMKECCSAYKKIVEKL